MRVDEEEGDIQWIRQMGTSGNDRLAHGGSGLMVLQDESKIVLFGDTTGSLLATTEKPSELFVMQVALDGTVPIPSETSNKDYRGGDIPVVTPRTDAGDADATSDGSTSTVPSAPTGEPIQKESKGHRKFILPMIGLLSLLLFVGYRLHDKREEQRTERQLVFSYLQAFDLEDVDVRQSATGGWHGTYVGKLAQGEHPGSLAHSSIVKDSLFVDYDLSTDRQVPKDDDSDDSWGNDNLGPVHVRGMDEVSGDIDGEEWGSDII